MLRKLNVEINPDCAAQYEKAENLYTDFIQYRQLKNEQESLLDRVERGLCVNFLGTITGIKNPLNFAFLSEEQLQEARTSIFGIYGFSSLLKNIWTGQYSNGPDPAKAYNWGLRYLNKHLPQNGQTQDRIILSQEFSELIEAINIDAEQIYMQAFGKLPGFRY